MSIELLWTLITLFVLNIYKICRYIICQNNQHLSYFCVILFICKMRVERISQHLLLLPGSRKPKGSKQDSQNLLLLPGSRKLKGSKQDSQKLLCLPGSRKHKDSINRTAKIYCGYLGEGNPKNGKTPRVPNFRWFFL